MYPDMREVSVIMYLDMMSKVSVIYDILFCVYVPILFIFTRERAHNMLTKTVLHINFYYESVACMFQFSLP
jgi:hypothetical protein